MRNSVFCRPFGPNSTFKQLTNALYSIIHDETSFLTRYFRLSNTYIIHILTFIKSKSFAPYSYYSPLSLSLFKPCLQSSLFERSDPNLFLTFKTTWLFFKLPLQTTSLFIKYKPSSIQKKIPS
ncbi:hypothetical protein HanIR_Chr06g0283511 [Helianthus annuus]|nr:hypothetical protein HanIR_Chr06g0283511 [Helianthus annuus]